MSNPEPHPVSSPQVDVRAVLTRIAMVIANLPKLPGHNGSVLVIDDEEARRIGRELTEVSATVAEWPQVDKYFDACLRVRMSGDLNDEVWELIEDAATKIRKERRAAQGDAQ